MLVIHYTGMRTGAAALARLCDPAARVSAHYMIEEDGRIFRLVREEFRAWHAGVAFWRGERDVNSRSIGVELVNPGHEFGYRAFPRPQMEALIGLAADIVSRHPIPARNVVGHSDIAPRRKCDPGEKFDWEALAWAGIGLWPKPPPLHPAAAPVAPSAVMPLLAAYGYEVPAAEAPRAEARKVIEAFQRHFMPDAIDGEASPRLQANLEALLRLAS